MNLSLSDFLKEWSYGIRRFALTNLRASEFGYCSLVVQFDLGYGAINSTEGKYLLNLRVSRVRMR